MLVVGTGLAVGAALEVGAGLEVGDALEVVVGVGSTVGAGFWVTRISGDNGASVPVDFTLSSGAALADS